MPQDKIEGFEQRVLQVLRNRTPIFKIQCGKMFAAGSGESRLLCFIERNGRNVFLFRSGCVCWARASDDASLAKSEEVQLQLRRLTPRCFCRKCQGTRGSRVCWVNRCKAAAAEIIRTFASFGSIVSLITRIPRFRA